MPDILITPGTFNPPGTPVQVYLQPVYPKVPVKTLRKRPPQWSTRFSTMAEPPVLVLDVNYTYADFITGDVTVGVITDSFDSGAANITLAGARYVADGLYAVTGFDSFAKQYSAVVDAPYVLSGSTQIDIGTIEVGGSGSGGLAFSSLLATVDYDLTLTGLTDGATYTTSVLGSTVPGDSSGTIEAGVAWPVNPATNGWIDQDIAGFPVIVIQLKRNGLAFDIIYLALEIVGVVHFTTDTPVRPTVSTGETFSQTLHGPGAVPGAITPPSLPYTGYARESVATQGTLTPS